MSTLLEDPPNHTEIQPRSSDRLRTTMAAMRLSFSWFGIRKSLTAEQRAEAAGAFGAECEVLSAGKRLINTRHPKYKAVSSIRNRSGAFWKAISLPYPEPGIRLVKQDDVDTINRQMSTLKNELEIAVEELNEHYAELKSSARERLGRLFDPSDYPLALTGLFEMQWDWPSVEPPPYLRQLSPALYREECQRVQARFDEAVQLAEQAFTEELSQLVTHLSERLSGGDDGKPKIFRDSAVENLTVFFARFRQLNIRSNKQLDALVDQANDLIRGVQPQQLRESQPMRDQIAMELSGVTTALDDLLVDRPRRNILRRPR